jgi:hypothetical protein
MLKITSRSEQPGSRWENRTIKSMMLKNPMINILNALQTDAYLFGRFANNTPFALITITPDAWKHLVASTVVKELVQHGLIAPLSPTEKSRNHALYITDRGRKVISKRRPRRIVVGQFATPLIRRL